MTIVAILRPSGAKGGEPIRKIIIAGCYGRLGRDLVRRLVSGNKVFAAGHSDFDITNESQMRAFVTVMKPDVIINAAAISDVDRCEENEEAAIAINAIGCRNLAVLCRESGIRLVSYSTDYVFDGDTTRPYTESDPTNPINAYGKSKLEGEKEIEEILDDYLILRVSWLYGSFGSNFVKSIIEKGQEQNKVIKKGKPVNPIRVIDDRIGNPTWTKEVARQTERLLDTDMTGVVHCTSEAVVSWYRFSQRLFELMELDVDLKPCSSSEFTLPARRPRYSSLENCRLKEAGLNVMARWDKALEEFIVGPRTEER